MGDHWIDFYEDGNHFHNSKLNTLMYFDSFGVEHILK